MPRILLINPNPQQAADIKFLLQLNGYQTEVCETLDEGVNRFQIFWGMERGFDLVLAVVDGRLIVELEKFDNDPFYGRMIVVHERRTERQDQKGILKKFPNCDPNLVLDCVKYHLKEIKNDDSGKDMLAVPLRGLDPSPGPKHC